MTTINKIGQGVTDTADSQASWSGSSRLFHCVRVSFEFKYQSNFDSF